MHALQRILVLEISKKQTKKNNNRFTTIIVKIVKKYPISRETQFNDLNNNNNNNILSDNKELAAHILNSWK